MDAYGWPDDDECLVKIKFAAPTGLDAPLTDDIKRLREAVIAEFEGPIAGDAGGGTGRSFTPTMAVRHYDGTGYPEVVVDDIVPTAPFVVTVYDTVLQDVQIREQLQGRGWNILCRPQATSLLYGSGYGLSGLFTLGKQNITVAATFGYAAQVPRDIWEAVRCEVAYRSLVQAGVGLSGVGGSKRVFGSWQIADSVDKDVWMLSSPLPLYHTTFMKTVMRYRVPKARVVREMAMGRRMS